MSKFKLLFIILLAVILYPPQLTALPEYSLISEAVVDVTGAESDSEFVEIYNPTGAPINIGGWDIGYKTASGSSWSSVSTIPAGETIPAFGYYLIGGDKVSPVPDYIDTSLGFSASGGHIALRNYSNVIIDKLGYGNAIDPEVSAIAAPGIDKSLERKSTGADTQGNAYETNNNSNDFVICNIPCPQNKYSQSEIPPFSESTISFSNPLISQFGNFNVSVIDADKNNDPNSAETFAIKLFSSIDTQGITVILKELNNDTSVFDAYSNGILPSIAAGASSQQNLTLGVRALGDTVTAAYAEYAPYSEKTVSAVFTGITQIKINEVMINPSGSDLGNEWLELFNASSSESINIGGWIITDENASQVIALPDLTLPPQMFAVIFIDAAGTNDYDFSDSKALIYSGETTTVMFANTKDEIGLYCANPRNANTIVDFIAYSSDGSYTPANQQNAVNAGIWSAGDVINISSMPENNSIILNPDGDDNNFSSDWSIDPTPTQGFSNTYILLPQPPANLTASAGNSFVVLEWTAGTAGENPLIGYNVYRSQTSGSDYSKINSVTITALTYIDNTVENEDTYYFIIKSVDVYNNESNGGSPEIAAFPTSAYGDPSIVRITEFMYDPEGDGITEPDYEWIEVYNPSYQQVNISGCILTDGEGSYTIPAESIIPAQSYFVFGYSALAAGSNVDRIYGGYTSGIISLTNSGDNIILKKSDGVTEIDRVDFLDEWRGPTAWYNTVDNKTLSRKYIGSPANIFTNWARSASTGGTPKSQNVLDLVPPVITHDSVQYAAADRDLGIYCVIEDIADKTMGMGVPKVYYRQTGNTEYTEIEMYRVSDINFHATIPYYDVATSGIEYYIYTHDWSNNIATHASSDTPHSVTVIEITDKIAVNELMYDPAYDEPNREWFELYNYGDSEINLTGWSVGDGEGFYYFDTDLIMTPNSYLVLSKADSTLNGGDVILYGDSAPEIQFTNVKAVVSDQVILKNALGLVVDELDYSPSLGAENIGGPNETSLERLSPFVRTNDSSNWAYSMEQGGSPGRRNSAHYVWNLSIEPTLFNPTLLDTEGINSCTIAYYQSVSGTAAINIYDENYNLIRTLINNVHRQPGIYYAVWNGRDSADTFAFSVNTVEIEVVDDTEQRTCVHKINDKTQLGVNDRYINRGLSIKSSERGKVIYYLDKPCYVKALVSLYQKTDTPLVTFINNEPRPAGSNIQYYDGRTDTGNFFFGYTSWSWFTTEIQGNAVITQKPFKIIDYSASLGKTIKLQGTLNDTFIITYFLTDNADITTRIIDKNGNIIKTLENNLNKNSNEQFNIVWDGKNELGEFVGSGTYTFNIKAVNRWGTRNASGEVTVVNAYSPYFPPAGE